MAGLNDMFPTFSESPFLAQPTDMSLALQPGTAMATQPGSWYSRITPGQIGGISTIMGTLGKSLMHPGNPMQGAADASIKYGPGMAQKEMLDKLISALQESKPAGMSTQTAQGQAVSPLAPAGATNSMETSGFFKTLFGGGK